MRTTLFLTSLAATAFAQGPPIDVTAGGIAVTATTEYGDVVGRHQRSQGVNRFYGIRFGQTTAGANRFKNPIPPTPWTTPQQAITHASCAQWAGSIPVHSGNPGWAGSEDCLFLDVVAPNNGQPGNPTNAPAGTYPVQFWIYGGGFALEMFAFWNYKDNFYASGDKTNLAHLPANGMTVSVFVNYRVNYLGGLSHLSLREPYSGNYNVQDQLAGLKWTQRNIGNFGGDPNKVTIQGESAGATSVMSLVTSPQAYPPNVPAPLFRGAIAESVWPMMDNGVAFSQNVRDAAGNAMAWVLGCTTKLAPPYTALELAAIASCFRSPDLSRAQGVQGGTGATDGSGSKTAAEWAAFNIANGGPGGIEYINFQGYGYTPCVDGFMWTKAPREHVRDGVGSSVAILVGNNADEEGLFQPSFVGLNTSAYVLNMGYFYALYGPNALGPQSTIADFVSVSNSMPLNVVQFQPYYSSIIDDWQRQTEQMDDGYFTVNIRYIMDYFSAQPGRTAGLYRFLFAEGNAANTGPFFASIGVPHTAELNYVWGYYAMGKGYAHDNFVPYSDFVPSGSPVYEIPYTNAQITMGASIQNYWANFIHTGNPSVAGDGRPTWGGNTQTEKHMMVFQSGVASGAKLDPCMRLTACWTEPAANYRAAQVTMWTSGLTQLPAPATCSNPEIDYTHIPTYQYASTCGAGVNAWTQYTDKNCYPGQGATDLGLLGYVTTVDACKARCSAQSGCQAITIYTESTYMACYSRANVVISQCADSSVFDTYILTGSSSGVSASWNLYTNKNTYSGVGSTSLGLMGYVQTVDECKNRCLARTGCEGFVISKGSWKACHARAGITVSQAADDSNWDLYLAPGYTGNGRLAGTDPTTGQPFPDVDRGVPFDHSEGKVDNDKPIFFGLGALTGGAAVALVVALGYVLRANKAAAPKKGFEMKVVAADPKPATTSATDTPAVNSWA